MGLCLRNISKRLMNWEASGDILGSLLTGRTFTAGLKKRLQTEEGCGLMPPVISTEQTDPEWPRNKSCLSSVPGPCAYV